MIGEKNVFVPHPDLSSQVDLDVELGVITKTRSKRSVGNLVNEARALYVWDIVLTAYNNATTESGHIASPKLLAVKPNQRALRMTFRPGLYLGRAVTGNQDTAEESLPLSEVRKDIAYRLGSLAGLKAAEGFVHGDYQQRHLLHMPLVEVEDQRRLSVIDVESSCPSQAAKVTKENEALRKWFMSTAPRWQRPSVEEAYQDGFSTAHAHAPLVLHDAIREAHRDIQ